MKNKEYKQQMIECPICKCHIGKYRVVIHEETNKHKRNLTQQAGPETETN